MGEVSRDLLQAVAARYARLKSLSMNLGLTTEVEEQGQSQERRLRLLFAAPDMVRIEQGAGKQGTVMVADGAWQHDYFGPAGGRYMRTAVDGRPSRLGFFSPEYPANSTPLFLFHRIAERVSEAKIANGEAGLRIVSVTYAPPELPAGSGGPGPAMLSTSGVRFWIDPRTHLVIRMETDVAMRIPGEEDVRRIRSTWMYSYAAVDEPVGANVFQFTPPPGAQEAPSGFGSIGSTSARGGASRSFTDPKTGNRYETQSSTEMEPGGTLVERGKLTINGAEVAVERRFKLSADRREMRISQTLTGAAGETRLQELTIPVKPE
jgi:outer membrane lipoprotein-sorting protein